MALAELVKLVRPPEQPIEVADDWSQVEVAIGSPLPLDFKQCIGVFGTGVFADFLWVFSPFSSNSNLNLLTQIPVRLKALKDLRAADADEVPYPLFPELGGLLPWGMTDNGDGLYWRTGVAPDEWSIVVNAGREPDYEEFAAGMTTFVTRILAGEWRCTIFPEGFPRTTPRFLSRNS